MHTNWQQIITRIEIQDTYDYERGGKSHKMLGPFMSPLNSLLCIISRGILWKNELKGVTYN